MKFTFFCAIIYLFVMKNTHQNISRYIEMYIYTKSVPRKEENLLSLGQAKEKKKKKTERERGEKEKEKEIVCKI